MKSTKVQYVIIGIMCFMLTIGICVQIKTINNNGGTLSTNQKESELKSQVLKMKEKYEIAYNELEIAEKELEKVRQNATNNNTELKDIENEIKNANKLLGLTNVKGSGVIITLKDGIQTANTLDTSSLLVHDRDILNVINELKNAGAEAIEVNGERIVWNTACMCDGNIILVNGKKIGSPFVITAIGLPESLTNIDRAGGYLNLLKRFNVYTDLSKSSNVNISKYTGIFSFKYAKEVK